MVSTIHDRATAYDIELFNSELENISRR